jgi:Fe-S-cluster-containing hydrogenase component 2
VEIVAEECKMCLVCVSVCPVQAISDINGKVSINKSLCLECGCCASSCPSNAIKY